MVESIIKHTIKLNTPLLWSEHEMEIINEVIGKLVSIFNMMKKGSQRGNRIVYNLGCKGFGVLREHFNKYGNII